MSNIPPILLEKLAELRQREELLGLAWGAARVTALLLLVLLLACAIDWFVDLWDETPFELRTAMFLGQLALASLATGLLILLTFLPRLRDDKLALFVEDKCPQLQHRLISALQLNREGARNEGMSAELLAAMTREATRQVESIPFARLADHRRLRRGALVLAPVALLVISLMLLFPETALALLQRQLGFDVDIPRSIELESVALEQVKPSGEEVDLYFTARGPDLDAARIGSVRIRPDGQSSFTVPLTFVSMSPHGTAKYLAKVRPASVDFYYTARLGDGRTRKPSRIKYVPRPSIEQQEGYLILPEYVGLRPDGKPYEQHQPTGDISGMPELKARIVAKVQKPIFSAILQTYGSPYPELTEAGLSKTQQEWAQALSGLSALGMGAAPNTGALAAVSSTAALQTTVPLRKITQSFDKGSQHLEWTLKLRPTETSYSIVVFDEYGFQSKTQTVRTLKIEPEPPPTIVLLHESFPPPRAPFNKSKNKASFIDYEGLPLPIVSDGKPGKMPISYDAFGPYGIGKVQLKIGVFRGQKNSGQRLRRGILELWATLELEEFPEQKRVFNRDKGAFVDSPDKEQIHFYPLPVPAHARFAQWPRIEAGGRFDYKVAGFVDIRTGKPFEFLPGDHLVVYLEVFNRNPKKPLMAKSQKVREKDLTTFAEWEHICYETLQEASRIEALMYMQQQVYDRPWYSIFGFK
jgi:hypothetical protein